MALITTPLLKSLFTGYNAIFQRGLGMANPQYKKVASIIASSTASNTYGWLGQWPAFREWVGDRVMQNMKTHSYQIFNEKFESSVSVDATDIEDDNLGVYSPMMEEMGRATAVFPDQKVFPLLKAGFSTACYDGQNFFDLDHPVNALADGQGSVESVSNVLIDEAYEGDAWYLLDTTRALKPIIYQDRKKPKFTGMTAPNDESVFMRDEYRYGVSLRCSVGFGFWQMAYAAKAPLTVDNLWAAYSNMTQFKADGGRPLDINPNMLVVPKSLRKQATQLLERELFVDGSSVVSNELRGMFEVVVPSFL